MLKTYQRNAATIFKSMKNPFKPNILYFSAFNVSTSCICVLVVCETSYLWFQVQYNFEGCMNVAFKINGSSSVILCQLSYLASSSKLCTGMDEDGKLCFFGIA